MSLFEFNSIHLCLCVCVLALKYVYKLTPIWIRVWAYVQKHLSVFVFNASSLVWKITPLPTKRTHHSFTRYKITHTPLWPPSYPYLQQRHTSCRTRSSTTQLLTSSLYSQSLFFLDISKHIHCTRLWETVNVLRLLNAERKSLFPPTDIHHHPLPRAFLLDLRKLFPLPHFHPPNSAYHKHTSQSWGNGGTFFNSCTHI